MQEPKIIDISSRYLVGMKVNMSLSENRTQLLWRGFKPRVNEILYQKHSGFYSISSALDGGGMMMKKFDPTTKFEKWAAVEVEKHEDIPQGMLPFTINEGKYAVFIHHGLPHTFPQTLQYILNEWLPQSAYQLADEPNFEIMGYDYRLDDPDAKEEVWFPIVEKI